MAALLRRVFNRARDVLYVPPLDPVWRRQLQGKVICLLYHRVDQPGRFPFLDRFGVPPMMPMDLGHELAFLKSQGADFLTFSDLRRGHFPGRDQFGVIVSFDDCLADTYRQATGVLEWLGIPGVLFQTTGLLDAPTLIWEHSLYWHAHHPEHSQALSQLAHERIPASRGLEGDALVKHLRSATPMPEVEALLAEAIERAGVGAELASLAAELYPKAVDLKGAFASGHEIASHGHHHYPRESLTDAAFEAELQRSSELIAAAVGKPPRAFSYPFNSHQSGDAAICARHYWQVATVEARLISHDTPRLEIPRCTWPGPIRNPRQFRRWLWSGHL